MCCLIITKQYAGRGKKKHKHGEYKMSMLSKGQDEGQMSSQSIEDAEGHEATLYKPIIVDTHHLTWM